MRRESATDQPDLVGHATRRYPPPPSQFADSKTTGSPKPVVRSLVSARPRSSPFRALVNGAAMNPSTSLRLPENDTGALPLEDALQHRVLRLLERRALPIAT